MADQPKSDSAVVRELMSDLYGVQEVPLGTLKEATEKPIAMVVPKGMNLVSVKSMIAEYLPQPERRAGTATLLDQQSFIAWTNRFKAMNSAIFVNNRQDAPSLTSIIDYHPEGPENENARWSQHRGHYAFPLSKQWKTWTAVSGKYIGQRAFAEFLEDNCLDVLPPPGDDEANGKFKTLAQALGGSWGGPADLMGAARDFKVNEGVEVVNAQNSTTGELTVHFKVTQTGEKGGSVSLPNLYLLGIPVFEGEVAFRIPVRLRWRRQEGAMVFALIMHRPDIYFDDALNESVKAVAEGTGLPIFVGKAES